MTIEEINKKLSELKDLRNVVESIAFPDQDRETFRRELIQLTDSVLTKAIPTNATEREAHENAIKLAIVWNEMLKDSNGYRLCPEMSFVVSKLIASLDPQAAQKIVVFTLGNFGIHKLKKYKKSNLVEGLIYISHIYKVNFSKEPVFIRVPDEFKDDILSNIVLFHEVGHFAVNNYAILDYVYEDVDKEINGNTKSRILREYFPSLYDKPIDATYVRILQSHIEEYIADIIGCIYSGKHILNLAMYMCGKNIKAHSEDHPSFYCRMKMIEEFVRFSKTRKTDNYLLTHIVNGVEKNSSIVMQIKTPSISEEHITAGTASIDNWDTLFSMFIIPWDLIIKERDAKKMKKLSLADYHALRALPLYQHIDGLYKGMIHTFMTSNP